ncbi:MAG: hypothetical protein IJ682_12900 [Lachnospiraceae bacterium]|nr:hypothetical protein [Lachnospiraceae bacterium]
MSGNHCLYLHIGTPKTGTSSLQEYLAANSKALEEQGFLFDTKETLRDLIRDLDPDASRYTNGSWILKSMDEVANNIFNREFLYIANMDIKALSQMAEVDFSNYSSTFRRYIASTEELLEKQNVILSNEILWSIPPIYLKQLYLHFHERIRVIVYLRRQDFLLESFWNHAIRKSVTTVSFDGYISIYGIFPNFKRTLQYRQTLDEISGIIGRENLIVRIYGAKDKEGNPFDIKKDFAGVVGFDYKKNIDRKNKNTRITGQMIEYIRVLNSIINELPEDRRPSRERREKILDILSGFQKRSCRDLYFQPEDRQKFLSAYEEDNAYIAKTYLRGSTLSDEGVPEGAGATVHTLTEEEIDRMRFLIALVLS